MEMYIYLESSEYDEALTALGYTNITDTIYISDLPQWKIDVLTNILDEVNCWGYSFEAAV